MTLLINPIFWVVTIAVYFLLLTRFPGSLTFRFGLFNLIALYILVGWETTLGALGFVLLIWITLNIITALKNKKNLTGSYWVIWGWFSILVFSFLLHKLNLGNAEFSIQLKESAPWFPSEFLLPFFTTLSFSYIFVRCIDLARSCILENTPLVDPISLVGYLMPFHMLLEIK